MTARRIALQTLVAVTDDGAYANLALKDAQQGLAPKDAAWVAAAVYGTLDHLLTIDYYLASFAQGRQNRMVRGVLRMGVCQLLFLRTPAHAAISESVALCCEIGKGAMGGFVNAVLRNVDRSRDALPPLPTDPVQRLSVQYSFPAWLVLEWVTRFGAAEAERMLTVASASACLRAQYPCTADVLSALLPVPVRRGALDPNALLPERGLDVARLPEFIDGRMTVQSESAMLVCRAMGDVRGKRVLDACAAPGGKSAYLWSLAEGDLSLTAWELHEHRKTLLEQTFRRLHVTAEIRQRDAAASDPACRDAFDAVLIDAPCSGLGLLHEKPDIRYRKTSNDVDALAELQSKILNACADYVRPGGLLVYATCTISTRENEAQIARFLAAHPAFRLEPMPIPLENDGTLQLLPHVHHTDGFFLSRMRRCI